MGIMKNARCGLAVLALACSAPAAQAQPPVELVGPSQLVCSPASPVQDLVAQCPHLPGPEAPQALAAASPNGFEISQAVPARDDERGPGFYVFGETVDGHAGPYLAFAPPGSLGVPEAWEFFTGRGLSGSVNWVSFRRWQGHTDEQGHWSPGRRATVFARDDEGQACGGFQGGWNAGLKRWLMFYACSGESRVRVAAESWGPWSDAIAVGGSANARARLLSSTAPEAAAAAGERKADIYWLSQKDATGIQVFRSTLRQPGAD